ncbi:MAG: LptA/OstA family protein, partial [Arenicellales bacterium]
MDDYRQSLLNAYSEVFSGICEPDRIDFKAADAELKPGAVAIEADQTELIDKKIVFTGNAELERDGMMINADRLTYDKEGDSVTGQGDIRIQDPSGNVFQAQSMEIEVETLIGTADDVQYSLTSKVPGRKSDDSKDIRA